MAEDPQAPDKKASPPPPDAAKSAPPPPPAPAKEEPPPPPLQVGPPAGAASATPVAKDAAGADASIGNRIIATLIDFLVATAISITVGIVLGIIPFLPGFIESFVSSVSWIAYLLTRDSLPFLQGQSIGKKAMKLRAVTLNGQPLTEKWEIGLFRNIPIVIPLGQIVELIVLATRQDKPAPLQRLGDEWAKTKVVNEGPPMPSSSGATAPPASHEERDES